MRCKICGTKLAKENADICLNCYKAYQEEEDLKKDIEEKLIVKRRYKISYVLLKYFELIFILTLATLGCIVSGSIVSAILCAIIAVIVMLIILALNKMIARNTKVILYTKKATYTSKNIFFSTNKTVKYSDLKDITVFQTYRQKRAGFGDICFYAKGSIPGATLLNGFQIKDVENVNSVMQQILEVIGLEENKK